MKKANVLLGHPKKKYYYLKKYGGTPCRSLNGKPLRYDMNEETGQVVKLNPTNYTTEGNKRFAQLFPNGVDEKVWWKNKQRIKRKINIWKNFRTPGKEIQHGYFKKVWFNVYPRTLPRKILQLKRKQRVTYQFQSIK